MTGDNNQNQQIATAQRVFQVAVQRQIIRETNVREIFLITALFLQDLNMFRVIAPKPDIQSRPRQMYRKRRTPRACTQNSNGFMLRTHGLI